MFKEMRRKELEITREQTEQILDSGEFGTLATVCDNGWPYAIAVNYAWHGGHIYFHCVADGQKLCNIQRDARVCFTVVTDTHVLPEKATTQYKSAVVFGTACVVCGDEKLAALEMLVDKYMAPHFDVGQKHIAKSGDKTAVVRINVTHMSGKAKA